MGNCGGFCKLKILGSKGDIILEKNSNNDTGKYLETDNAQKIILLQKALKQYLKKKKSSKATLSKKASPKSPNDDAFRQQRRLNNNRDKNGKDPRDGPFDNKRRKYPKIKEDQSSYEGEWKNGKRDGFGILCWGEESKFMGYFEDDKVIGYGKLWQDNGDMYKGNW